jgi:hypothetical protein
LAEKVGNRIFLEGLNRETSFPFIVYTYNVERGDETKDGDMDNCQLTVYIFSKDGDSSLELAHEARKLLEHSKGDYANFSVLDTLFESYIGRLEEDVFVRELNFNIKTY